jgi:hypothetical protein
MMFAVRRHHQRGMATLTAIVMIGLVGVTLATVSAMFIAQNKRTRAEAIDAQLRQLLTAGAAIAMSHAGESGEHVVKLPADSGTILVTISASSDSSQAVIRAQFGGREKQQVLRMARRENRWVITDALLGADQAEPSTQPSERSTAASQRS